DFELPSILPALQIVNHPVEIVVKLGRVCCARPPHLFDDWITHCSLLQKLLRRTEYRRLVIKPTDDLLNLRTHPCVGDMPAVPGDQVFHSVGCSDADVQCVAFSLG